jgi:hypothetical protein
MSSKKQKKILDLLRQNKDKKLIASITEELRTKSNDVGILNKYIKDYTKLYKQESEERFQRKIRSFVRNLMRIKRNETKLVMYTYKKDPKVSVKKDVPVKDDVSTKMEEDIDLLDKNTTVEDMHKTEKDLDVLIKNMQSDLAGIDVPKNMTLDLEDMEVLKAPGDPEAPKKIRNKNYGTHVIDLYEDFLKGNLRAYEELESKIEKGGQQANAQSKILRQYINKHYGYKSDNPLYVKSPKKKAARIKGFKDHFNRIGYVKKLTNVIPKKDLMEAGKTYNAYLHVRDPEGVSFLETFTKYIDDNYKLRDNLNPKEAREALSLANKRLALLGQPSIRLKSRRKGAIKDALNKVDLKKLVNIYESYPHLESPEKYMKVLEKTEKIKKSERESAEVMLMGMSPQEYARMMVDARASEDIVKAYLKFSDDGKHVELKLKDIKEPKTSSEAADSLYKILMDISTAKHVLEAVRRVKDEKSFKVNTRDGRRNIIASATGKLKISKKNMEDSITVLGDTFKELQKTLYGSSKGDTIEEIAKNINAVRNLPETGRQFYKVRKLINNYTNVVKPKLSEGYQKALSETVNAPDDVRVLPPGVQMKEIPEEEMKTHGDRLSEINKRLKEIGIAKIGAKDPSDLYDEEKKLRTELIDVQKKASGELKQKASRKEQNYRASKRAGYLRPHLKNPTVNAVENEIGKTPEQQIKDFSNWFIFDIPSDQSGQGTAIDNPLVKQNKQRTEFMGLGNIFDSFQQPYNVVEGVNGRKDFAKIHNRLTKPDVEHTIKKDKIMSEEEEYLQTFNKNSNGLFTQDQTYDEINNYKPIYQTPGNFMKGTLYPPQETTNSSLYVSDFKKNLNYFIEP